VNHGYPLSASRRSFLESSAAITAGQAQGQAAPPPRPAAEVEVPKIRFFRAGISRMVLGANPFYGFAHNNNFATAMNEWYTHHRVCEVLHQCNRFGINSLNYVSLDRAPHDGARFQADGGQVHRINQLTTGGHATGTGKEPEDAGALALGRGCRQGVSKRQDGHSQRLVQDSEKSGGVGRRRHAEAGSHRPDGGRGMGRRRCSTARFWPPGESPTAASSRLSVRRSKAANRSTAFTWECSPGSETRSGKTPESFSVF